MRLQSRQLSSHMPRKLFEMLFLRLNQQHHMGGGTNQSAMMQMQCMGGAQNTMNPAMGRPNQMVNQVMTPQVN